MNDSQDDRIFRLLLLSTLAAMAVVFFWGLGDIPLLNYNEARRALPARDMFLHGDWLLPRLNGEPYLAKPPLLYWLQASASHLYGSANEWAVRLPSALAAGVVSLVAYRYARHRFGAWPALFTVQLLVANASFAVFARRAEIELLLTALCFCALLSALKFIYGGGGRGWLRLSYFLLGAALLTKGPLALLFVTLPLLCAALHGRQPRQWLALRDWQGWGIALAVGGAWYLVLTWQMGFEVWQSVIQKDIVGKVAGSSRDPWYGYLLSLTADFFPASLVVLCAAPVAAWRCWKDRPETVALAVSVLAPLAIYSVFSNKHAKYLLPAYPVIAILLGKRLGDLYRAARPLPRRALLAVSLLLPAGYAAFFAVAESRVFEYRYSAFPEFAHWLAGTGGMPVYGYVDLDERLIYYAGRNIPMLDQRSLQALQAAGPALLLLVENARAAEIEPLADCVKHEFTPYLKKGRSLMVYGFGSACGPAGVPGRKEYVTG